MENLASTFKPCPFCGSTLVLFQEPWKDTFQHPVNITDCILVDMKLEYKDLQAWNRRVSDSWPG